MGFRLETVGLDSMMPEILEHICSTLSETDIDALSQVSRCLQKALNENFIWKRFVPKEAKSLKTQNQLVDPPLLVNSNLCENCQDLIKKNRLIQNWREGKAQMHSTSGCFGFVDCLEIKCFKENYLYIQFFRERPSEFWFIGGTTPVLHT